MKTFSALLAPCAGNPPVTGEFLAQRPVTRSFGAFFDLCLNKRLSKQPWGWWFETPSRPLWRHCNELKTSSPISGENYEITVSVWDIHVCRNGSVNEVSFVKLTHWGRVTHICVSKLTIIGSDNGLSPGRRQAIIWTNAGIWLIRTLGTNFSEILGEIHSFSFSKMHLKMSSAKWRLFAWSRPQ